MKKYFVLFICLAVSLTFFVNGQEGNGTSFNNYIFIQANNHLEKRGSNKYYTGNPDIVLSYERRVLNFGKNNLLAGVRTGFYREYVLTGQSWVHPEKNRFFIGISPSYRVDISDRIKIQVNGILDILLPDDYDEQWWYFAVEPSFNFYFTDNIYCALSAAMGIFPYFDPKAYMDKAGLKLGVSF